MGPGDSETNRWVRATKEKALERGPALQGLSREGAAWLGQPQAHLRRSFLPISQ